MTNKKKAPCNGCGKKEALENCEGFDLCNRCRHIADELRSDPNLVRKIAGMVNSIEDIENLARPQELPDVLDAVRYRTRDREKNTWYVSVSELNGDPVEIFASTAFDRDQHLQSRISNLTTITRLISLILRNVYLNEKLTLEKTLRQLLRSSRQKNDLPEMLTRVLANYSDEEIKKTAENDTI